MKEHEFADLLGKLDPELVARAEAPVPRHRKPSFRIALVAAALAILICAALPTVIPFIPTTLELDYPANGDMDFENVWIYYTDRDGHQKSEYVRLPYSVQNVFTAWAHLSGLDESAQLYEITSTEGADADRQVIVTLSTALRDHPDSEQLLASLEKTLVRDFGVLGENFTFDFSDIGVWSIYYNVRPDTYSVMQGSQIEIAVGATNVSLVPVTVSMSGAYPYAELRAGGGDDPIVISPEVLQVPDEPSERVFAPGESIGLTYTYQIPSDAACTKYDLYISVMGREIKIDGLIQVEKFTVANALSSDPSEIQLISHKTNLPLPRDISSRILGELKNVSWKQAELVSTSPSLIFQCGVYTVSYSCEDGVLNFNNIYCATASENFGQYLFELLNALNGWQMNLHTPLYDMIMMVDGMYYGHNESLTAPPQAPEADTGTVRGPTTQDSFVAVHSGVDLTPYLDQQIRLCEGLLYVNGVWFEPIPVESQSRITIIYADQPAFVLDKTADLVLGILQRQEWTNGVIDLGCDIYCKIECDDARFQGNFGYSIYSKIITCNQKYCEISDDDAQDLIMLIENELVPPQMESSWVKMTYWQAGERRDIRLEQRDVETFCSIFNTAEWRIAQDGEHGSVWVTTDSSTFTYNPENGYFSYAFYLGKLSDEKKQTVDQLIGLE